MSTRTLSLLVILVITGFSLASCAPATTATPTPLAGEGPAAPLSTDALETPLVTPPMTEQPPHSAAACLQGIWLMEEESFAEFTSTLLPIPNLSILSGMISLSFDEFLYIYSLDNLVLRFTSSPGNYIQGTGFVSATGSFTVVGDTIEFTNASTSSEITDWEAMVGGVVTTFPGNPPELFFSFPGNGAFTCTGNTLTIDTSGTANTANPMQFTRME